MLFRSTISPDEAETQELDVNVATVSQAPWDDETPGPSYSSSEQVHAAMSSLLNTSDSSDEELVTARATSQIQGVQTNEDLNNDSDSSSDNCVIVGFVKPLAERTPELVELSSDSDTYPAHRPPSHPAEGPEGAEGQDEDLQDLLELTPKKDVLFIIG